MIGAYEIRDVAPRDESDWRALWTAYCDFYRTALAPETTNATWRRLLDPSSAMVGRVAAGAREIAGFSVCVLHDCSWTVAPVCYLEDLYVAPAARGSGAGRALIEDVLARAAKSGWARVYLHTREDNAEARRLYDRFSAADGFIRYQLQIDGA